MTHTVRTTLRPDKSIEVGDAEYLDLQRDGLLIEDSITPTAPATATTKKAASPAISKEG